MCPTASFQAAGGFQDLIISKCMHDLEACFLLHSAFMLSVVKLLLKGAVGVCALNSHGNYNGDHGKSWKNHEIVFLISVGTLQLVMQ